MGQRPAAHAFDADSFEGSSCGVEVTSDLPGHPGGQDVTSTINPPFPEFPRRRDSCDKGKI